MKFTFANMSPASLIGSVLLCASACRAIQLDINSKDSIKSAASQAAYDMMRFYQGNVSGNTPGTLPGPAGTPTGYYWWEGGAMFGALIDYWWYTGDSTYNDVTTQGLLAQVGEYKNYEPSNYTLQLGNDDQAFWGMAALLAAETNFPNPPADQPQWLSLAQAVINRQVLRWYIDDSTCGGGLKWQFNPQQKGYSYKNSISNACLFNMAARVGRYTQNASYFEWADRVWDWSKNVGMISQDFSVYDGADIKTNCSEFTEVVWSYSAATYIYGAAVMWNQTQNNGLVGADRAPVWEGRLNSILNRTLINFFRNNIMTEFQCEEPNNCNSDQRCYKSVLARYLASTAKVAPFTYDTIYSYLRPSAQAAARNCNGGDNGVSCGQRWTTKTFDGNNSIGEQMNALEIFNSLLVDDAKPILTIDTGGTSQSDPGAGNVGGPGPLPYTPGDISTADRAGAGILTALCLGSTLAGGAWMMF